MFDENNYNETKQKIASNLNIHLNSTYNGDLSCRDAGKIGGVIGGNMVKNMIIYAEEKLAGK